MKRLLPLLSNPSLQLLFAIPLLAFFAGLALRLYSNPAQLPFFQLLTNWLLNWLELGLSGISMGFLVFMLAAGMTLVFGLLGVFNLAHGAFIALGTFVFVHVVYRLNQLTTITESRMWSPFPGRIPAFERTVVIAKGWLADGNLTTTMALLLAGLLVAFLVSGGVGYLYERFLIRSSYGQPTRQLLMALGGAIILIELMLLFYASETPRISKPALIAGNLFLFSSWQGGLTLAYSRLYAGVIGLAVFVVLHGLLTKTRVGLIIRAGTENREMAEAFGYSISKLFVLVFIIANLLATLGGTLYALNLGSVSTEVANDLLLLVVAAIMIGGLGSLKGCLIGSILVMLSQNYMNGLYPPLGGEFTAVLLMLGVLLWRPQGLEPCAA